LSIGNEAIGESGSYRTPADTTERTRINSSDMTMMIMTGGRERTQEEFSELFSAAGFHLEQVIVTKSSFTLMVGAPA